MTRTIRGNWLLVVGLLVIAPTSFGVCAEPNERTLIAVDGASVLAKLQELKPDWSIAVIIDGEEREVAQSDYVLWGNYSDQDGSSQVLLTDGTVLVGNMVRIEAESITIASRLWGELRIARRLVRACLLLPAASPLERDRQWQLLQQPNSADRILLLNTDTIAGRLLPTTVREAGGLFGLVSVGIGQSDSNSRTSVKMEEVHAITFHAQTEREMHTECLLGFRDGSLVAASQITRAEPGLTQIATAAHASLQLRTDEVLDNLTFIQPRSETVDYLSDLPAVGYKSLPLLTLDWPLGINKNTLGGRFRSAGNVFFKGLGMHSASRVAYTLDGKYRRFQAELALDDHAQQQGSVVYRVLVERDTESGQRGWKLAFTSPIIRGGDLPLPVAVDVTDATRLALVVEMSDRADTRDYANWLNARLLR